MQPEFSLRLNTIDKLTSQLRMSVETMDWDKANHITALRHHELEELFRHFPINQENSVTYHLLIEKFLLIEKEIQQRVQGHRDRLLAEHQAVQHRKNACEQYQMLLN